MNMTKFLALSFLSTGLAVSVACPMETVQTVETVESATQTEQADDIKNPDNYYMNDARAKALFEAIELGDFNKVSSLMYPSVNSACAYMLKFVDDALRNPLHIMAMRGRYDMLEAALMHKVGKSIYRDDVAFNALAMQDKDGNTPLHLAVIKGESEVVQTVAKMRLGEEFLKLCRFRNKGGSTVLHLAVEDLAIYMIFFNALKDLDDKDGGLKRLYAIKNNAGKTLSELAQAKKLPTFI